MQNSSKKFSDNARQAVSAVAPLLIVIILFVIVGKFGVPKVLEVRSKVESAQKTEKVLTQKLSLLQTLSSDSGVKMNIVSVALPDANPAVAAMSQLKSLALNQGVVLHGITSNAGAVGASGLNEVSIKFTLDGGRQQIFSYLNEIAKIAPITSVRKVAMTESAGGVSADINVVSYWAQFPKTIPAVDTPVEDFTAADKNILSDLSALIQPVFFEMIPSSGDINPNPFGQ